MYKYYEIKKYDVGTNRNTEENEIRNEIVNDEFTVSNTVNIKNIHNKGKLYK
jgi:hypothetical protein